MMTKFAYDKEKVINEALSKADLEGYERGVSECKVTIEKLQDKITYMQKTDRDEFRDTILRLRDDIA